jgi:hypothetical protein
MNTNHNKHNYYKLYGQQQHKITESDVADLKMEAIFKKNTEQRQFHVGKKESCRQ